MNRTATLLSAAGVALAGCFVGAGTITDADVGPAYTPQFVNYAARSGEFPTAVFGNPFGADADAQLLAGMWIPGDFTPAKLTAIPKGEKRNDGHLVFLFDPEIAPGGRVACRAPDSVERKPGGANLRLQGAFCYDDEMISEAVLNVARPQSPNDPNFNRAMNQFLAILFTPRADRSSDCTTGKSC